MSALKSEPDAETQQAPTTHHSSAGVEEPSQAYPRVANSKDQARNAESVEENIKEQPEARIAHGEEEPGKIHNDTAKHAGKTSSIPKAAAETMVSPPKHRQPSETRLRKAFDMYKRILKLQHKFFEAHTRLNSERDAIIPRLDSLNESLSHLGRLLERFTDTGCSKSDDSLWSNACVQFTAGRQSFQNQMHVVDDQEQELDNLLYSLAKLEPKFLQVVNEYFKDEQDLQLRPSPPSSSHSQSSSRTLAPLEQQYYDKRGDVHALQERLINHRVKFRVPSDNRPTPAASSTADKYVQSTAFQSWWETEHESILQELRAAEDQLAILWKQCQDANFDVGILETEQATAVESSLMRRNLEQREVDPAQPDIPPFLPQNRHGVLPDFLQDINWPKQRERIVPLVEGVNRLTGKQDFIEEWINRVKTDPPQAVEFKHSILPLKSEPEWAYLRRAPDDKAIPEDYVMVEKEDKVATNGPPEDQSPGIVRRLLRRVMSKGALNTGFRQVSKPNSRESRRFHRSTEPNESLDL